MRENEKRKSGKYIIICLWAALFIFSRFTGIADALCGKGIDKIHGEYYRFLTASFLHTGAVHLIGNCIGLYFVTGYLDGKVNGIIIVLLGIAGGTIANLLFAYMTPSAESSMGGSVIVFAIIGMIAAMQIMCKSQEPFRFGTWYGNWTAGYMILGNLLNGSLKVGDISTLKIHLLSLVIGCLLGAVCILSKIIS